MKTEALKKPFVAEEVQITVCLFAKYRLYNLEDIYQSLAGYFESRGQSYQFIIITKCDNPEGEIYLTHFIEAHSEVSPYLHIFRVRENMGKASALKAVEKFIRGHVLLTLTTGGIPALQDVEGLLAKMDEGYDLVNGVRNWKGEPVINKWESQMFNWVTRKFSGSKFRDLNSTIKVFRRSLIQNIPMYGDFYRFLPVLAERYGFRVTEMPVTRREEQRKNKVYGPSSYIRRLLDVSNIIFITKFTEKPLRFFGGLGMFFAVPGTLITLWLGIERIFFKEALHDRPLLLLGILILVMGVQIISIGLIGEIILYSRSMDFKPGEIEKVV